MREGPYYLNSYDDVMTTEFVEPTLASVEPFSRGIDLRDVFKALQAITRYEPTMKLRKAITNAGERGIGAFMTQLDRGYLSHDNGDDAKAIALADFRRDFMEGFIANGTFYTELRTQLSGSTRTNSCSR